MFLCKRIDAIIFFLKAIYSEKLVCAMISVFLVQNIKRSYEKDNYLPIPPFPLYVSIVIIFLSFSLQERYASHHISRHYS